MLSARPARLPLAPNTASCARAPPFLALASFAILSSGVGTRAQGRWGVSCCPPSQRAPPPPSSACSVYFPQPKTRASSPLPFHCRALASFSLPVSGRLKRESKKKRDSAAALPPPRIIRKLFAFFYCPPHPLQPALHTSFFTRKYKTHNYARVPNPLSSGRVPIFFRRRRPVRLSPHPPPGVALLSSLL
jgi:hypothetical protein